MRTEQQKGTEDGILIIDARRFRTQGRNREDATGRLVDLIRNAAQRPKFRRKTRPTLASKIRRLESKRRGGESIVDKPRWVYNLLDQKDYNHNKQFFMYPKGGS